MKTSLQVISTLLLATCLFPVYAHTGVEVTNGFYTGFVHPWSGVDHMLVMFLVGLYAAALKDRSAILLPFSFVVFMMVGAASAHFGLSLPAVEKAIVVSLLFMGALLAFKPPMYRLVTLVLVSYFAMCHGYAHAHAIEISPGDEQFYLIGFVLSTGLLHGLGLFAGRLGQKHLICLRMLTAVFSIFVATLALVY
ncbi:MAG: HupE/UreJ family protein [Methyloglobulus sp.]|nr:HupE/UreJ family protein [Methyloglobulus sp.]